MTVVHVIGGGLAGSEAAWQLTRAGVAVTLHEMRPVRGTDAHKTGTLAELVCSNSFRSDDAMNNAVGLLHEEMRRLGSLIMTAGDAHKLPAGGALAVDREAFAGAVEAALEAEPLVTIARDEVDALPSPDVGLAIVATGQRSARRPVRRRLPSSMRLPRLLIKKASILTSSGSSPATTNPAPAAPVPTISTVRWTKTNMKHSSMRSSKARATTSRSGSSPHPISKVACRSR